MTAPTYRITSVFPKRAERVVHKPYVTLSVLQVMDVVTTGIILGVFVGAGREGNPFVSTIFHHAGLIAGLAILLVLKLVEDVDQLMSEVEDYVVNHYGDD